MVTLDAPCFLSRLLRCKVPAETIQLCHVRLRFYTVLNVSSDFLSLHLTETNGHPAGQSNGGLPSCNGDQWQCTMREWSDPDCFASSNVFLCLVKWSQSLQCTVCGRTHKQPTVCFQSDPHVSDRMLLSHRTSRSMAINVLKLSHMRHVTLQLKYTMCMWQRRLVVAT